jgi:cytochrome c6
MKRLMFAVAFAAVLAAGSALADSESHELFEKKCSVCHGKDGKPTPMGEKMGAKSLVGLKDAAMVATTIENGKPPKMAAFKGKLTDAQIQGIARYVANGLKD